MNGAVYVRERWYAPATGTFLSPDPLGYVDSGNLYTFAGGDPVNRRDPTGKASVSLKGVFVSDDFKKTDYGQVFVKLNRNVGALYRRLETDRVPMHLRDLIVERVSHTDQGTQVVGELGSEVSANLRAYSIDAASTYASSIPFVGDAKDAQEVITGKDLITGEHLTKTARVVTVVAAVLPVVGGKAVRSVLKSAETEAAEEVAEEVLERSVKYGVNDPPVHIEGEWSTNDLKQALLGHPPRGLGSPDLHHADQMPGSGIHEVAPHAHRNNPELHPNKYNQGVTREMREQDRRLHWWYRAREEGADDLLPDWIYDNGG
ncbi:MAG: pre-toxin TG domain-containing protein [Thermoanaerobaculia bacterium]